MPRIYCPKEFINKKEILIKNRQQIHYLCDVLRVKLDTEIVVFDGQGHAHNCNIEQISKKGVRLAIKSESGDGFQWRINLAIACALPKQKNRFDDLIDKLTQLGVNRIIPMLTDRVALRWDCSLAQKHSFRWRRISEQACIQSARNVLPIIDPVSDIDRVLAANESYNLKLIPSLTERSKKLKDVIHGSSPKSILILIGPEGDFTKQELTKAKESGFSPVSLGNLTLRVDAAAIAVAAFFRLYEPG